MTAAEALAAALRALVEIDRIAEDSILAEDAVDEIKDLTGELIGDLARAGFVAEPS